MEFGTVTRDDLPELLRLYTDLVEEIRNETRDEYFLCDAGRMDEIANEIEQYLGGPERAVFVARDRDNIVGFIAGEVRGCLFPLSRAGPIGYIAGAYVRPGYRRKGVAARLEQILVDFFKERGAAYAELNVMSENCTAKWSWSALGYGTFREQMRKRIL